MSDDNKTNRRKDMKNEKLKREEKKLATETTRLEETLIRLLYEQLSLCESGSTHFSSSFRTKQVKSTATHQPSPPRSGSWKSTRTAVPAHYTMTINSFSLLSKHSIDRYVSGIFKSGGYNWQLLLFPNGEADPTSLLYPDKKVKLKGKHYMSLYLAIVDTEILPTGWEVNVLPELFIYSHIEDKYVSIHQEGEDRDIRFNESKKHWGHEKFISLSEFKASSKGYLVNDTCIFGAEAFVCKSATTQSESFTAIETPNTSCYTWKIEGFTQLKHGVYGSGVLLSAGEQKCSMQLKLKSKGEKLDKFASLYLLLKLDEPHSSDRVCAKFILRARDQRFGKHRECISTETTWFRRRYLWGFEEFMDTSIISDPEKGFVVDDTLIVEAEVTIVGSTNCTPQSSCEEGLVKEEEVTLTCPICVDVMKEETSTPCGHIFCKSCITRAISIRSKCPSCRKYVWLSDLRRIYMLPAVELKDTAPSIS